jgi:hypothetical protein
LTPEQRDERAATNIEENESVELLVEYITLRQAIALAGKALSPEESETPRKYVITDARPPTYSNESYEKK